MRLRNAPLVHVLAEVGFSPVLEMATMIPAIQADLRSQGFPWIIEGALHQLTLVPGGPPQVTVRPRWAFHDRERTTAVVLTESSLVVHTTEYSSVEPFLEMLTWVASTIAARAEIALVGRIGLRYIDRVPHTEEDAVREYVVPGVLGFPLRELADLQGVVSLRTEITGLTEYGTFVVRSVLLGPGQVVPPDLDPPQVHYPARPGHEYPAIALDFDHFTVFEEETIEFDPATIAEHAARLHATMRTAFDVAVTPYALEKWGPWEEA